MSSSAEACLEQDPTYTPDLRYGGALPHQNLLKKSKQIGLFDLY
jgi:hypothetical protein